MCMTIIVRLGLARSAFMTAATVLLLLAVSATFGQGSLVADIDICSPHPTVRLL